MAHTPTPWKIRLTDETAIQNADTDICAMSGEYDEEYARMTVSDVTQHPRDIDDFARLDGFKDYAEMHRWFAQRYGQTHFTGYLHRWEWL